MSSRVLQVAVRGAADKLLSGPFDITFVDKTGEFISGPVGSPPQKLLPGFLSSDIIGLEGIGAPISLARAGDNSVLAVYPAIELAGGLQRQVAAVVRVTTTGRDHSAVPVKIIRAQAETGSVLLATFIEDDRRDAPAATSMLYWVETTSQPQPGDKMGMLARYMLFTNGTPASEETMLSDPAGWEVMNTLDPDKRAWLGDYMKGAFYFFDGAMNFVAAWPEVDQGGSPPTPDNEHTQVYIRVITIPTLHL